MTDYSKRANLRGTFELRGVLRDDVASPSGVLGAEWESFAELRADDTTPDTWQFTGEASVVDHSYTVYDMFGEYTETVKPGAFTRTLNADPLVSFVYMHDISTLMAQTHARSLDLTATPNLGAAATILRADPDAQRLHSKMGAGLANSMSFKFRVMKQTWNEDYTERDILEVNLDKGDVSAIPTGHAANPAAHGTLRSLDLESVLAFLPSLDDEARASVFALLAPPAPEEIVEAEEIIDVLPALAERMALDTLAFRMLETA